MLQDKYKTLIADILIVPIAILLAPFLALAELSFYVTSFMKPVKRNKTLFYPQLPGIAQSVVKIFTFCASKIIIP